MGNKGATPTLTAPWKIDIGGLYRAVRDPGTMVKEIVDCKGGRRSHQIPHAYNQ